MTSMKTAVLAFLAALGGFFILPVVWGGFFGAVGPLLVEFFGIGAAIDALTFMSRSVGIVAIIGGILGVLLVIERE